MNDRLEHKHKSCWIRFRNSDSIQADHFSSFETSTFAPFLVWPLRYVLLEISEIHSAASGNTRHPSCQKASVPRQSSSLFLEPGRWMQMELYLFVGYSMMNTSKPACPTIDRCFDVWTLKPFVSWGLLVAKDSYSGNVAYLISRICAQKSLPLMLWFHSEICRISLREASKCIVHDTMYWTRVMQTTCMDGSTDLDAWMGGFNCLMKQSYKFMMYLINW